MRKLTHSELLAVSEAVSNYQARLLNDAASIPEGDKVRMAWVTERLHALASAMEKIL